MREDRERDGTGDVRRPLCHDALLIGILLALGGAAILLFFLFSRPGGYALVTVDGEEVGCYPLAEDGRFLLNGGTNTLVIAGGGACIEEASCPDKVCEHTGRISRTGERIVCLPNRVMVEIVSAAPHRADLLVGTVSGRQEGREGLRAS